MYTKILSSKPCNLHYLNRYIRFIENCREHNLNKNYSYVEKHHICPKSKNMFPEYASFKKYPWNMVILTYRQHIIAHIFLMKAYKTPCQALAVIRTIGQYHVKNKYKTKQYENAKILLSKVRKGVFTRGYLPNGKANVTDETKAKISNLKKQFYSIPENRKKQSDACIGTTGRKSEKYSISAKNRTAEHLNKISNSLKKHYDSQTSLQRKKIKTGIYVTPIGNFSYSIFGVYCITSDKIITIHNCKFKNSFFDQSCVGMTPRELGFYFIPKNHPELQQYCVDLNLAHPPEPNHLLALKLNDYLLREKLLP